MFLSIKTIIINIYNFIYSYISNEPLINLNDNINTNIKQLENELKVPAFIFIDNLDYKFKNILDSKLKKEYNNIINSKYNNVIKLEELSDLCKNENYYKNTKYYYMGDINDLNNYLEHKLLYLKNNLITLENNIYYIKQLCLYTANELGFKIVDIGEIPVNINGLGIMFRNVLNYDNKNIFNEIENSHTFQNLTESNKPGKAYRTGIYLTDVQKDNKNNINFNLLRCSTNLSGPTSNFRSIDNYIIKKVNKLKSLLYIDENVNLNHVLAQIYHNGVNLNNNKLIKAKIAQHSDKTKDMPKNGLMAFCTFYKEYNNNSNSFVDNNDKTKFNDIIINPNDEYDFIDKKINNTILTKLRFRKKPDINDDSLIDKFDLILYPNSVFIMSLKTNRLYTHEIIPPIVTFNSLPTRMGYVIRCSETEAIYNVEEKKTYIKNNNKLINLYKPTEEESIYLKNLYKTENLTTDIVYYNDIYFTFNNGDFMQPII